MSDHHCDLFGPINSAPTQFPDLNFLLTGLTQRARSILGTNFVGAYLQGSFAVGNADRYSDCDFLIPVHGPITAEQEAGLRALHHQIPTRPGHWSTELEGSYPDRAQLQALQGMGQPWLSVDHGAQQMQWSTQDNTEIVRWCLRERGITLVGPHPTTLVDPVPGPVLQRAMRRLLPRFGEDLAQWANGETAWSQRHVVATYARMLHTLATGQITSKPAALHWGLESLDERWHPLLTQALTDARVHRRGDRPRPGSVAATLEFAHYAQALASSGAPSSREADKPSTSIQG